MGRVLHRQLAAGPTAWEACPPPSAGQINVFRRDSTLVARALGSDMEGCCLIRLGRVGVLIKIRDKSTGDPARKETSARQVGIRANFGCRAN